MPALAELLGAGTEEKVELVVGICAVSQGRLEEFESESIAFVFTSCFILEDLRRLKRAVDAKLRALQCAPCVSLYELVYAALAPKHSAAVVAHFQAVAGRARVLQEGFTQEVVLLSDIDDTLVSTLKDWRYPFGTLYPGVRQFYCEILGSARQREVRDGDEGELEGEWEDARHKVVFVTARPPLLDSCTTASLGKHGFHDAMVLTGGLSGFVSKSRMLSNKVEQCRRVHALFPENMLVLNGDNGQADVELGEELLRLDIVQAVFIHNIYPAKTFMAAAKLGQNRGKSREVSPETAGMLSDSEMLSQDLEGQRFGIALYETYAGAAYQAYKRKILDAQSAVKVVQATVEDMDRVKFKTFTKMHARRLSLRRDIMQLRDELEHSQEQELVKIIDGCLSRINSKRP